MDNKQNKYQVKTFNNLESFKNVELNDKILKGILDLSENTKDAKDAKDTNEKTDTMDTMDTIGISQNSIKQHKALYKGYVDNANALIDYLKSQDTEGQKSPETQARRRRLGFELSGKILHEYYFENLTPNCNSEQKSNLCIRSNFENKVKDQWGCYDKWLSDFKATGLTRGVGWAICAIDPTTKIITNNFIQLHEDGNIPNFDMLLVMDVWEHAYVLDRGAGGRSDYIDAFCNHIDWSVVDKRLSLALESKT